MKENDLVKVHLYDTNNKEIKTRNIDKVFKVYKNNGKLGIDWNTEHNPCICNGEVFTPFYTFASSVIFENVETGKFYHFNNIENSIVEKS